MSKSEQVRVHIRWMIRRDMPEVLQIDQKDFAMCWQEEDFLRCLRQRNCIGMVAEAGERVVGFMIYELHKHRLELLRFAVDPKWQRRGVGTQMIEKLISKLSYHRRTKISFLERESNLQGLAFAKNWFRAVRILPKYFVETGDDAFLMAHTISGHVEPETLPTNRISEFVSDE